MIRDIRDKLHVITFISGATLIPLEAFYFWWHINVKWPIIICALVLLVALEYELVQNIMETPNDS